MAANTTTHSVIESGALNASQPGALDGHYAKCACGFVSRTSLDLRFAVKAGWEHADYMNRKAAR